jgi:hypothetical protein
MNRKILQSPISIYLIIAGFSAVSALIFFQLGGGLADITGNSDLGFGFKAGGALAGFILVFWMSVRVIERLYGIERLLPPGHINMKVYLYGAPENFDRNDTSYTCRYSIFNEETGEKRDHAASYRWENGYFTIDIPQVGPADWIAIRIENSEKMVWECDFFHSRAPKIELKLLPSQ